MVETAERLTEAPETPRDDERQTLLASRADTSRDKDRDPSSTYKLIKTFVLCWLFFVGGAYIEVIGPILPELVVQTSSSYESVMRAISMRGVGFVAGGIIAGLSVDKWFEEVDLVVAGVTLTLTAVGVGVGYVVSIDALFLMFLLQGFLEQWFRTAVIRIILKLWKQKSSAALYAIHFGSAIAYVITPKITGIFVDPRFSGRHKSLSTNDVVPCRDSFTQQLNNSIAVNGSDVTQPIPKYPADFVYALWIFAVVGLLSAIVFVGYYINKKLTGIRYEKNIEGNEKMNQNFSSILSPRSCSPTKPMMAALILVSAFFYYGVVITAFLIFPKMIFSYARDAACLSVGKSTTLHSTYFIFVAVGRLASFALSTALHPKYIMQVSSVGALGSVVALYIGSDNPTVLWIGVAGIGLFLASTVPGMYAVVNHYIEMTAVAMIVPMVGGAIGDVVVMYFLGPDFETNVGPKVLWTYMLVLTALQCLTGLLLQILCHVHGERFQMKETTEK